MNNCIFRSGKLVFVLILALGLVISGCKKKEQVRGTGRYDFTLQNLQGKEVSFSDFHGQVIMVNFWAPWCGPCRMETPDLIQLDDQYGDDGLQILGVAVAFRGEQTVRDFARQAGITYPVLFGDNNLVQAYGGFRGIPTTFLFSRDGGLYRKYEGMRPKAVFEKDVVKLL